MEMWIIYCIVLYFALYCIVLYCIVLYCTVLYCTVLYCIVLYCIVLCCIVWYPAKLECEQSHYAIAERDSDNRSDWAVERTKVYQSNQSFYLFISFSLAGSKVLKDLKLNDTGSLLQRKIEASITKWPSLKGSQKLESQVRMAFLLHN